MTQKGEPSMMRTRWTPELETRAKAMFAEGWRLNDIDVELGIRIGATSSRFSELRRLRSLRRAEPIARARPNYVRRVPCDDGRVPIERIADRDARAVAPRSLTAEFFGDPPVGWSALDRRK